MSEIVANLRAGLPRHVTCAPIEDEHDLLAFLRPFDQAEPVASAVITKREVLAFAENDRTPRWPTTST